MSGRPGLGWRTSPEAGAAGAAGALLVVPLGSTEQHGPHLPLSSDTVIARALATGLASRRGDVEVAPALGYGASGEHRSFPGTLSIGQEVLEALVVELGRSASETFARVLFLSAHGGNAEALSRAVARLSAEGREARAFSPRFRGDAHAGRTETSLLLLLAPHAVHLERAEPGATEPVAQLFGRLRAGGLAAVTANGVLGDPRGASAAHGRELLASALEELDEFVAAWRAATPARAALR